jgi:fumarate reductase subunit D
MSGKEENEQWLEREKAVLDNIIGRIEFYSLWCEVNRWGQRIASIIVLICAVVAPVAVISTKASGLGTLGFTEEAIKATALIVTVALALTEGMRRVFRFDHRWAVCAMCRARLLQLHGDYKDTQIGREVGSPEWISTVTEARKTLEKIVMEHIQDFAEVLKGDGEKENKRKRLPGQQHGQ